MTTTLNAVTSTGLVQTSDGSGVIKVQSNGVTTNALAWVNFNGVTTTTIRSSYNVSSITRNSTGDYTVNFASALSNANYVAVTAYNFAEANTGANNSSLQTVLSTKTSSSIEIRAWYGSGGGSLDVSDANLAIFGN